MPTIAPPSNTTSKMIKLTTASLNFVYRPLSGGANEPCGKYGGGVYVAISFKGSTGFSR